MPEGPAFRLERGMAVRDNLGNFLLVIDVLGDRAYVFDSFYGEVPRPAESLFYIPASEDFLHYDVVIASTTPYARDEFADESFGTFADACRRFDELEETFDGDHWLEGVELAIYAVAGGEDILVQRLEV